MKIDEPECHLTQRPARSAGITRPLAAPPALRRARSAGASVGDYPGTARQGTLGRSGAAGC